MMDADRTFYNGKIYTMNAPGETVEAIVVRDGKIAYAGSNQNALGWKVKEKVDLGGLTGLPGFIDTHIHVLMDCLYASYADLGGAQSIDDVINIMKDKDDGGEGWLYGAGVSFENLVEKRFPHRNELDRISTERPIHLISHCGHIHMINSKALFMTKISNKSEFDDECLEYYDDGEPSGILMETAYGKYLSDISDSSWTEPAYQAKLLESGLSVYPERGLTTLHAIALMPNTPPTETFGQYYELEKRGKLPVRVIISPSHDLPWSLDPTTGFGTDMVKLGAKKIFLDGSLGGRTAAVTEPYADAPEETGIITHTAEELTDLFREAYDEGLEVSVHVIGDAAMECVLDAAEKVYPVIEGDSPEERLSKTNRRLRIIHAMIIGPGHIERIKRLPIILDVQPAFLDSDVHIAMARLGEGRLHSFMPLRSFIDGGVLLTGGSDAPVDPAIPLNGIQCAVTRRDLHGFPEGGLVAEEAVSVYEAVAMYTKNAAYCSNEEHIKGTISAGKFADFILLDRDIFETEAGEISSIKVVKTVLGGETTFQGGSESLEGGGDI
ncbi:MAG: amidohydrolase [Clostridiales Family XIII bacterium]|jgi:predicted amidohydrolase YtcJ|nr:amidohydrolase [Clostridiales Family XIII bacterium]